MINQNLPRLCDDSVCTGCGACSSVCEQKALNLISGNEGFYRPLINTDKCISCGLCEKVCPVLNGVKTNSSLENPLVYAAWNKDENVRAESSSGGVFSALAETVLEMGGIVCGAAYANDMSVSHICIEKKSDLSKLRLSKYVQSYIGDAFRNVKEYAKQGRTVLFCGTPCQAAGLRNFLRKDYPNIICCDFICHGVPSPLMYKKYLEWIEGKYGKVSHINFRHKKKGWYDSIRMITFINGKTKILKGKDDAYWVPFNNRNCNLQYSCYNCHFLGFPRKADITIADFWGIGKSIPFGHIDEIEKGVSLLIGSTDKGVSLINQSKDKMECFERTIEEAINHNQASVGSSKLPQSRRKFYQDLEQLSFDEMQRKYMVPDVKTRLVKLFREYMPFGFVKFIRMKGQK